MNGRRGASEIENLVHLDEERMGDVVAQELETLVVEEMLDVAPRAGEKINAQDLLPPRQQLFTKMRAEKSCASRDQNAPLKMHNVLWLRVGRMPRILSNYNLPVSQFTVKIKSGICSHH